MASGSSTLKRSLRQRGWQHVRNGTLLDWVALRWRAYQYHRRMAWWDARLGTHGSRIREIQAGVRMRLYFDSRLCRMLFSGEFEQSERRFFNAFLRPGDVVVDVGANVGLFTLISASAVGPTGEVHAFEPCQKTFERLEDNVRVNGFQNVHCHRLALSAASGTAEMATSQSGMDAWNSIAAPHVAGGFESESIVCTTWNEFAAQRSLAGRVKLMKLDVEGWERQVLIGGDELLARDDAPVLQVEFTDEAAQLAGTTCAELYRQLVDLGYRMFRFDEQAWTLVPEEMRDSYPYVNLLAVKDVDEVRSRIGTRPGSHPQNGACQ